MTSGASWDELLNEAQEILLEREDDDPTAGLGDDFSPPAEGHFMGRWRGVGKMQTKDRGLINVFHVWDRAGRIGFLYQHANLVQEVNEQQPQVGDEVLVLRGPTREFEKDGETRKTYPYVLRRRECSDPLPDQPVSSQLESGEQPADESDIPF